LRKSFRKGPDGVVGAGAEVTPRHERGTYRTSIGVGWGLSENRELSRDEKGHSYRLGVLHRNGPPYT